MLVLGPVRWVPVEAAEVSPCREAFAPGEPDRGKSSSALQVLNRHGSTDSRVAGMPYRPTEGKEDLAKSKHARLQGLAEAVNLTRMTTRHPHHSGWTMFFKGQPPTRMADHGSAQTLRARVISVHATRFIPPTPAIVGHEGQGGGEDSTNRLAHTGTRCGLADHLRRDRAVDARPARARAVLGARRRRADVRPRTPGFYKLRIDGASSTNASSTAIRAKFSRRDHRRNGRIIDAVRLPSPRSETAKGLDDPRRRLFHRLDHLPVE